MKVKIKKDILWKSGTPPEKMQELEKKLFGFEQNWTGKVKQNCAEGFLALFPALTRKQIEDEIDELKTLGNSSRFRSAVLLAFAEMLIIGLQKADDTNFCSTVKKWSEEWGIHQ